MLKDIDEALRHAAPIRGTSAPVSIVQTVEKLAAHSEVGKYCVEILKQRTNSELNDEQWEQALSLIVKNKDCNRCADGYVYKSNGKGYSILSRCTCKEGLSKPTFVQFIDERIEIPLAKFE
jgi:hypothetical protein